MKSSENKTLQKITGFLLFALAVEGLAIFAVNYRSSDKQDDFMIPCIQHKDVNVCLAEWKLRK